MSSIVFQRLLCRKHRPIAATVTAASPLSKQSCASKKNQCASSSSIKKIAYGWRPCSTSSVSGNYPNKFTNNSSFSNHPTTFVKERSLMTISKSCTLDTNFGVCSTQMRSFQSVGDYHNVADETMHSIQDAVEDFLEDHYDADLSENDDDIPEVNYASGVLTMYLPPHGTWVINKQTPNQQIWWSSPISGPRRYEYDENMERWVYSRVVDENVDESNATTISEDDTLGGILNKEFKELFGESLDDDFNC